MNNPDLDIWLLEQLPPWYREVLDYQQICGAEQPEFDTLAAEINAVGDNFFLQTMDLSAVEMWEKVLHITPDPSTEDLAFRRLRIQIRLSSRPPYTMNFLRGKLDEIIGPGKWNVRMDYANYTLYVESSAENQLYVMELATTIGRIKPAHIVYVNTPLLGDTLLLSEEVSKGTFRWNYTLGTWALYSAPFRTEYGTEVIKMAETPSIQQPLLSGVAQFISDDVASVRINGTISITNIAKSVIDNTLTITYDVRPDQTTEVTSVELLRADGTVLTQSRVYVPVDGGVLMKHSIPVKEGI